jgi:hypothetical protein
MFDNTDFPKSLDEAEFDQWLEKGRDSKIGYAYLLIVWDAFYVEEREQINSYESFRSSSVRESLVAAYDLYSESRVK